MYSSHSLNDTGTVSCLVDNTSAANTCFSFIKAEGIISGYAIKKDKSKNDMKVKASPPPHWRPSSPSPSPHQRSPPSNFVYDLVGALTVLFHTTATFINGSRTQTNCYSKSNHAVKTLLKVPESYLHAERLDLIS